MPYSYNNVQIRTEIALPNFFASYGNEGILVESVDASARPRSSRRSTSIGTHTSRSQRLHACLYYDSHGSRTFCGLRVHTAGFVHSGIYVALERQSFQHPQHLSLIHPSINSTMASTNSNTDVLVVSLFILSCFMPH